MLVGGLALASLVAGCNGDDTHGTEHEPGMGPDYTGPPQEQFSPTTLVPGEREGTDITPGQGVGPSPTADQRGEGGDAEDGGD